MLTASFYEYRIHEDYSRGLYLAIWHNSRLTLVYLWRIKYIFTEIITKHLRTPKIKAKTIKSTNVKLQEYRYKGEKTTFFFTRKLDNRKNRKGSGDWSGWIGQGHTASHRYPMSPFHWTGSKINVKYQRPCRKTPALGATVSSGNHYTTRAFARDTLKTWDWHSRITQQC